MEKPLVAVGLSGGVDSAVAALLLQKQGYPLLGVFMQNWQEDSDADCQAEQDLSDARAVCDKLNIPLQTVNFSDAYWQEVFENMLDELTQGRTPNPDILCNREIKFKRLLNYVKSLGASFLATGHYAAIENKNDRYELHCPIDDNKDQSYFLYTLTEKILEQCLFPLAKYTKPEIRQIAESAGLINHNKKDSTGICFIGEKHFKPFMQKYLLNKPGPIKTTEGDTIAQHDGLMFYTIGQRKGLNIGGVKKAKEAPWYVVEKKLAENTLIVGQQHDHPLLKNTSLLTQPLHWINAPPSFPLHCQAQIRYRQDAQNCIVSLMDNNQYKVVFDTPQWAITPGQSIVLYKGNHCLGGGIIQHAVT